LKNTFRASFNSVLKSFPLFSTKIDALKLLLNVCPNVLMIFMFSTDFQAADWSYDWPVSTGKAYAKPMMSREASGI